MDKIPRSDPTSGALPESAIALPQVVIRQMRLDDLPALEWDGEYAHFRLVYQKVYARTMEGKAVMWAMEIPGKEIVGQAFVQLMPVGNLLPSPGGKQAYIHSFRVRPPFRSMGLGRRLLAFIESDLIERGFDYASLNVSLTNHRAKRLYTRMGYRIVGRDAGTWSYHDHQGMLRKVSEPGWYMRKKLRE
jgi:ribosomal-protein-alanine N-acetyltransferase